MLPKLTQVRRTQLTRSSISGWYYPSVPGGSESQLHCVTKILKIIQRKVLKGTHLPIAIKEIQAGYLVSPHFKDLYLCLAWNKLPSTKASIQKVEMLAEKYILLDSII